VEWAEQDFGGTTVVTFADNVTLLDMDDTPVWVQMRDEVPNTVDANGNYIYANGAVVFDEPGINQ
jgi:hypothetical protein